MTDKDIEYGIREMYGESAGDAYRAKVEAKQTAMTRADKMRNGKDGKKFSGLTDKEMARALSDMGFCTHYPGYTCDKDWPSACPKCIRRWLSQKAEEDLHD